MSPKKYFTEQINGKYLLSVILTVLFATACTTENKYYPAVESKPEVKAEEKILSSLEVEAGKDLSLRIKKSALNKEFLLMGQLTELTPTAQFSGLKSRIVAFAKAGNKLVLLEATKGHVIIEHYPTNLILAEFPILNESADSIAFDFNDGMRKIYTESDWYTSDYVKRDERTRRLPTVRVDNSYIADVQEIKNYLVIRQSLQAVDEKGNHNVEAKFYLTPYRPNPSFKPTESFGVNKVGFFEVSPLIQPDGKDLILASKFDINQPIVFALSANTPKEVRSALTKGVLSWNKMLGENRVQVIQLEDKSIVAPDPRYNIIQWIEDDKAGFAYADAQMDPRTGEILHAQIYMTSVFYSGSRNALLARIRSLQVSTNNKSKSMVPGLVGFSSGTLCRKELDKNLLDKMSELANSGFSDSIVEQALLDSISSTMAHEVGHTLGLRHNFSGSLASNIPRKNVNVEFKNYLDNGARNLSFARSTSSVMDYINFEEDILNGNLINNPAAAPFEYDQKALGVLYFEKDIDGSELPLYCTDSNLDMSDCKQFDSGPAMLEDASLSFDERLGGLASRTVYLFLQQKSQGKALKDLSLNAVAAAKDIFEDRNRLMQALTSELSLVSVRKQTSVPMQDLAELKELEAAEILKQIKDNEGLEKLVPPIDKNFVSGSLETLGKILESSDLKDALTEPEKQLIKDASKKYFAQVYDNLLQQDIASLSLANLKKPDTELKLNSNVELLGQISGLFKSRVSLYATTKSTETIKTKFAPEKGDVLDLTLTKYLYSQDLRKGSLALLSPDLSSSLLFGVDEKAEIKALLTADIKPQDGVDLSDTKNKELTAEAKLWILQNQEVLKGLE